MKFLKWLTLPDVKEQYEQQQPQPIFTYDPQQYYQPQPYQQPQEPEEDWRTFILDERIWSPFFFVRPGIGYVRRLQTCYKQLLKEKADSRLYNVGQLLEEYNNLLYKYRKVETDLAVANAELKYQNQQTETALEMSTKTQKRNQVLREHGYDEVENAQQKDGNKFTSNNGRDGKENLMTLACMDAYGIPKNVIADELDMKKTSVVTLASTLKKEYMTVNNNEGFCIHFSEKYGKAIVNLDEMFSDDWWRDEKGKAHPREDLPDDEEADDYDEYDDFEEEDDFDDQEEIATTGRGVIVKSIQKY